MFFSFSIIDKFAINLSDDFSIYSLANVVHDDSDNLAFFLSHLGLSNLIVSEFYGVTIAKLAS